MSKFRINPYRLFVGAFVPNWLLRRKELSDGAKLTYARMSQYAGRRGTSWPSQEEIARVLGVSVRQIRRYIQELVRCKLLESERPGFGRSNRYYFLAHPWIPLTGFPFDGDDTDSDPTAEADQPAPPADQAGPTDAAAASASEDNRVPSIGQPCPLSEDKSVLPDRTSLSALSHKYGRESLEKNHEENHRGARAGKLRRAQEERQAADLRRQAERQAADESLHRAFAALGRLSDDTRQRLKAETLANAPAILQRQLADADPLRSPILAPLMLQQLRQHQTGGSHANG